MKTFYFTFGSGQVNQGYCQPIKAENSQKAREKMVEMYGIKWAFQYNEEDFKRYREEGTLTEKLLKMVRGN